MEQADKGMNRERLTIGNLQIYFEDGKSRFKDRSKLDRTMASVELELNELQEFVERWLDNVEPLPTPRNPTPEEQQFSSATKKMAKDWRRFGFSNERIIIMLRSMKGARGTLTEEQADAIIEGVVSTL